MHNWDSYTEIDKINLLSLSENKSCFSLADFEDEDYVPESDTDSEIRKDNLYFKRHTHYHERFLAYNDYTNDWEDPDFLYEIWYADNIQHLQRRFRGGYFDGAYK